MGNSSELLSRTLDLIGPLDDSAASKARERQDMLTKPQGSLGKLEEISIQLAGIQRRSIPRIKDKAVIVMAGDHGIIEEKFHNWPQEVTAQMVLNFLHGGAAINVLSKHVSARVVVADMGVASPLPTNPGLISRKIAPGTANMAVASAMSRAQAVQAIEAGIEIVNGEIGNGVDLVGTGDMGIGNTSPSAAICSVVTGKSVSEVTGRGTGLNDQQLNRKIEAIQKAIRLNRPDPRDPIDILAKVGGFEIAGLAGVMLGAAAGRVAVVIDGFISGAAALIATGLCPQVKDYLFAGHLSVEPGHQIMLDHIGLTPLLCLDMRLGEGTGAALAMSIIEGSLKVLAEMATFAEASVSEANN
ncbi:MAG: nicotinate-nucleotide--dimethylbenzimidazole phosphoribosyltransferase [Deltaproteobacteria bacterium HGW-Deltaproteobacteria-15]|nr:MAG: nicotinate-nucleotide--dimethylbenzimidazole phosphoribosyltransferase [Deltaproteobacteria bacterium HGW-Deltaproteobacteria-15]